MSLSSVSHSSKWETSSVLICLFYLCIPSSKGSAWNTAVSAQSLFFEQMHTTNENRMSYCGIGDEFPVIGDIQWEVDRQVCGLLQRWFRPWAAVGSQVNKATVPYMTSLVVLLLSFQSWNAVFMCPFCQPENSCVTFTQMRFRKQSYQDVHFSYHQNAISLCRSWRLRTHLRKNCEENKAGLSGSARCVDEPLNKPWQLLRLPKWLTTTV